MSSRHQKPPFAEINHDEIHINFPPYINNFTFFFISLFQVVPKTPRELNDSKCEMILNVLRPQSSFTNDDHGDHPFCELNLMESG